MSAKKSFLLRINPNLFEVYESWAADELRSVNAHLEFILREAAVRAGRWPKGPLPAATIESANKPKRKEQ
ncbi:MAG TPA: hypothetical protein PLC88_02745 [Syntrophomonas sp.]|jgi:hypothetical protein|nr:hypothetical protein [Syntrophomonas sp.]HRW13081.1 hypothetical protein [Syntrophomonas sp.]